MCGLQFEIDLVAISDGGDGDGGDAAGVQPRASGANRRAFATTSDGPTIARR